MCVCGTRDVCAERLLIPDVQGHLMNGKEKEREQEMGRQIERKMKREKERLQYLRRDFVNKQS